MPPLVIWRLCDGKPGHESQTLGLVQALRERVNCQVYEINVNGGWRSWRDLLIGRCPVAAAMPSPDILVGAGHATHAALLACRRARGGRAVVLMRPSLPLACFDLCLIPEHDGVAARDNVLVTRGAINSLHASAGGDPELGVILLGGPSTHFGWDDALLLSQLEEILHKTDKQWVLTTSRRTPLSTLDAVRQLPPDQLQVVAYEETKPGWVAAILQRTSQAWITEDSVSMVYEALTAGVACGLLTLPEKKSGRVSQGVRQLINDRLLVAFPDWQVGAALQRSEQPLNEAARCADWISSRWFVS